MCKIEQMVQNLGTYTGIVDWRKTITYANGDTVFLYDTYTEQFYEMFNFSAPVGYDYTICGFQTYPCNENPISTFCMDCEISEKGTFLISDLPIDYSFFSCNLAYWQSGNSNCSRPIYWSGYSSIIGNIYGAKYPYDAIGTPPVRLYIKYEDVMGNILYPRGKPNPDDQCKRYTSADDLEIKNRNAKYEVYFFDGSIYLRSSQNENLGFEIYTTTGQIIEKCSFYGSSIVNINSTTKGIYIVKIIKSNTSSITHIKKVFIP